MRCSLAFHRRSIRILRRVCVVSWAFSLTGDCLFLFTQSERSPRPTQKLKKKSQSVSFVAASVIALNAAPALAVSPIEIQDKRVENAGGLQLIYEVRLSSFARYRTAVVYECFRFVFPSFTKARSTLFFVGRRRRKGMISRIKKSIFDTTFCLKKKESEEFVTKEGDIFLYDDVKFVFFSLF